LARLLDTGCINENPHAPVPGEEQLREPPEFLVRPRDAGLFQSGGDAFGVFVYELSQVRGSETLLGHGYSVFAPAKIVQKLGFVVVR